MPGSGGKLVFRGVGEWSGFSLPCGKCIGCRLERSRQWAVRLVHESKMHSESSFITLTFAPEFLPSDSSLSVVTCQLFLKRLRERVAPRRIRFFLCGEYGEKFGRPHYHAVIFGYGFPDKVPYAGGGQFQLYRSKELEDVWGMGQCPIGDVSFESAAYVANYATKKVIGEKAEAFYGSRKPEFLLMSRRPGIGRSWIEKYSGDVYPKDEVISRGFPSRPPRYYDQVLEAKDPALLASLKVRRELEAEKLEKLRLRSGVVLDVAPSRNARRLVVREQVAKAKLSLKSRRLDA